MSPLLPGPPRPGLLSGARQEPHRPIRRLEGRVPAARLPRGPGDVRAAMSPKHHSQPQRGLSRRGDLREGRLLAWRVRATGPRAARARNRPHGGPVGAARVVDRRQLAILAQARLPQFLRGGELLQRDSSSRKESLVTRDAKGNARGR